MAQLKCSLCGISAFVFLCPVANCQDIFASDLSQIELGRRIFSGETFDGNGRVCSSCHPIDRFGTITPEYVQQLFELDPNAPIFASIDSDGGLGASYERLKNEATIRTPADLSPEDASGLAVRKCDAPEETTAYLHRGVPSVFNIAFENFLMHDGRDRESLEQQAFGAIRVHAEAAREGTSEEIAAIVAFEKTLFSSPALRAFFESETFPALPDGETAAEIRGRAFFAPDEPCGICHSGPLLNQTSDFWPAAVGAPGGPGGGRFETVLVGAEPDNPNEKFDWCFVDAETNQPVPGPRGRPEVFPAPVSDPGVLMLPGPFSLPQPDGSRREASRIELAAEAPFPMFKIPTLWGTPDTAPYFHDNSAKTLGDVLDQYNFMFRNLPGFAIGAGCEPDSEDCLSEQDKLDIIAYMQLLSFE